MHTIDVCNNSLDSFVKLTGTTTNRREGGVNQSEARFCMSLGLPMAMTVNYTNNTRAKNIYMVLVKRINDR